MKKIKIAFIGLLMIGLGAGVVNAQDKAAAPAKKSSTTQTDKKAPAASGQHLKKDGTPDKRYKENKTTTTSTTAKPADTKSTASPKSGSKKGTSAKTAPAAK
jgi:hypothetical protein